MNEERNYLLPEWDNEEKIRVLMSPMATQDPVASTGRFTFWTASIHQWCRVTKRLTFTLQDCLSAFRRGTQLPLCLPEALLHMNRLGEAIPLDELPLGERPEESWIGWGQRVLVATPLRFTWKKVKDVLGVNNLHGRVFVNTKLLQEISENVLKTYWESLSREPSSKIRPLTLASLFELAGDCVGSADNLHLVVESLAYSGRATTVIHNNMTYVKFAIPGDTKKPTITQIELAEEDLQHSQIVLEASIAQLNKDISILRGETVSALKQKSKSKAMSLLRKKKRCEKSLDTQTKALENVIFCLMQLQDSQVNREVIGAFRTGVEALKASVSGDQSLDGVTAVMDDLQEVLGDVEDVTSLLASGVAPAGAVIDDDDLLKELDQLVVQDKTANKMDTNVANSMTEYGLPEVPQNDPVSSIKAVQTPLYSPP